MALVPLKGIRMIKNEGAREGGGAREVQGAKEGQG